MIVLDAAIPGIATRDHQVVGVAEYRAPSGGAWVPMSVESGSVSVGNLDFAPQRTCSVSVVLTDDVLANVTIFGTWVRLLHAITDINGKTYRVPIGYFRVNRVTVEKLAGVLSIEGGDAGCCIADYELVTLAQGEVAAGAITTTRVTTMLTDAMRGIVPWWASLVNADSAPAVAASARWQYESSRVDAVRSLLNGVGRHLTMGIDGNYVFRYRADPAPTDASVITLKPGDLGNVVTLGAITDRAGVANVAVLNYRNAAGEQISLSKEYTTGPTAAGGPFGMASQDADAPNITTDAQAQAALDAVLAESVQTSQDFAASVSPIYGIETGDVVTVVARDGSSIKAAIVGATIPLTTRDSGWTLRLRAFQSALVREVVW